MHIPKLAFFCILSAFLLFTLFSFTATHAQIAHMSKQAAGLQQSAFIQGSYQLVASEIDGTNAHMTTLPDLLHPILTFSSSNIYGLRLTHPVTATTNLVITASGTTTASGVAIKTSLLNELPVALHIDPIDLAVLLVGGTVSHLTIKNVGLQVDVYIDAQSMTLPGVRIAVV